MATSKSKSTILPAGKWNQPWNKWGDLPILIQASLFWAFTQRGPSSPEDYARLFGAKNAPDLPEASWPHLFFREEPRWMDKALHQLWGAIEPSLTARKRREAISIFMGYPTPDQVIGICDGTRDKNGDRWAHAKQHAHTLTPQETQDYRTLLDLELCQEAAESSFVEWLLACDQEAVPEPDGFRESEWGQVESVLKQAGLNENSNTDFSPMPLAYSGRAFAIEDKVWDLAKQIRRIGTSLSYGYIPFRRPLPHDLERWVAHKNMPPWIGAKNFAGDWKNGQKVGGGLNIDLKGLISGAIAALDTAKNGSQEFQMADLGNFNS